jgi:hypothetical protein
VFEYRAMTRIFGLKRKDVRGKWKRKSDELYSITAFVLEVGVY